MESRLKTQKIDPAFFERRDTTQVAWLGMAGALVNARGTVILIDPMLTAVDKDGKQFCEGHFEMLVPLPIEAHSVPRVDLVLYTHADDDHIGRMTAETLSARLNCPFFAPARVGDILREVGVAPERITTARESMTLTVGSIEIEVTPAVHDYPQEKPFQREDCCGYLLKTPDGTIWHPGDTRLIDELFAVKGVDVFFFDIFAVESHLGSQGSALLAESCGAKVMIAYHYGTLKFPWGFPEFTPEDAYPYIPNIPARYMALNPGEILELPV
jgi:L-ascorbate metabolism protein UlaG (beta-lactamase superfamily)